MIKKCCEPGCNENATGFSYRCQKHHDAWVGKYKSEKYSGVKCSEPGCPIYSPIGIEWKTTDEKGNPNPYYCENHWRRWYETVPPTPKEEGKNMFVVIKFTFDKTSIEYQARCKIDDAEKTVDGSIKIDKDSFEEGDIKKLIVGKACREMGKALLQDFSQIMKEYKDCEKKIDDIVAAKPAINVVEHGYDREAPVGSAVPATWSPHGALPVTTVYSGKIKTRKAIPGYVNHIDIKDGKIKEEK